MQSTTDSFEKPRRAVRLAAVALALLALQALSSASAASAASVTIGQIASGVPTTVNGCPASQSWDVLEPPGAVPGVSYSVPAGYGRITSWSTSAAAGSGQSLALTVYRQVSGNNYEVIEHDGPHTLTPSTVNTFSTDLPVKPGDLIGLAAPGPAATACATGVGGASDDELQTNLADGFSGTFTTFSGYQDNVSAVVQPPAPVPESAYIPDSGNHDVSQYDIGATGPLSPKSTPTVASGGSPEQPAISPNGRNLYVPDNGSGFVAQYDVGSGGLLEVNVPPAVNTGAGPDAAAVSPDGKSLYVADFGTGFGAPGAVSEYDIAADGTVTPKSSPTIATGKNATAIAVSRDGKSVYVTNTSDGDVSQYDIGAGGVLSAKSTPTVAAGTSPDAIAVSPDGTSVYVGNDGSSNVSQYDVGAGGALTPKSPATVAASTNPEAVAVSPDGRSVYVADGGTSEISQYDVGSGGALSAKTPATVAGGSEPDGIALTPDGRSLYLTNFSSSVNQYDVASNGTLSAKTHATVSSDSQSEGVAVLPDQSPVAAFTGKPAAPGSATSFDGSSSSASFGASVARYDWSFGDGGSATNGGARPTHTYMRPGNYDVTLTVTDSAGCSSAIVFSGQTAYCNGGPAAVKTATVSIGPAGASSPTCTLKSTGKRVFAATLSDAKHKKKQKKGVLNLTAKCSQPASLTLTGKVTAAIKKVGSATAGTGKHKKSKVFHVATVLGSIAAGQSLTLTVKLPQPALALLKKGARESVTFALSASNSNGTGRASAKIKRLKLAKTKHR